MILGNLIAQTSTSIGTFSPPTSAFSTGSDTRTGVLQNLETFVSNMIGFLTILATLIFVAYFLMGGLNWIMAGGDSGKVQKARDQMIQGVLGLVIVAAAYSIIGLIGLVLGFQILRPGQMIDSIVP